MDPPDDEFEPPAACIQWCSTRSYDLHVLDDGVEIDLDWWNSQVTKAGHEISLRARNFDGHIVNTGRAVLQRNDLRYHKELVDGDNDALGLLFLCAAWRSRHPDRRAALRFPDIVDRHAQPGKSPLVEITHTLDHCLQCRHMPDNPNRPWSAWPITPGVGVALLATFLWATDVHTSAGPAQLVDQHGVSTLLHEGWLEDPSVNDFTPRRYLHYLELLHSWARQADTEPELVEMWLVQRWNARVREARGGAPAQPTLF
ncbi:hypothetical protein G4X40_20975 [Rhodococcus sp. D2-41]|uniref:8-oxoguanine DNA glycosylase OGG fold protein n=1 Tax=Speluncibacter jeojiensis TaxID=2710754 RepID=UPI00240F9ABB|nr:hypothetical protein [Rhodococcus sp. D2-41]MDG3012618.1 hypothetical protein [Rhodococcus sp. D2-41]